MRSPRFLCTGLGLLLAAGFWSGAALLAPAQSQGDNAEGTLQVIHDVVDLLPNYRGDPASFHRLEHALRDLLHVVEGHGKGHRGAMGMGMRFGQQGISQQGDGQQGNGQGNGKQGNGKQGNGKQGNGKQGNGKQGNGKQGNGKQGNGKGNQQGHFLQGSNLLAGGQQACCQNGNTQKATSQQANCQQGRQAQLGLNGGGITVGLRIARDGKIVTEFVYSDNTGLGGNTSQQKNCAKSSSSTQGGANFARGLQGMCGSRTNRDTTQTGNTDRQAGNTGDSGRMVPFQKGFQQGIRQSGGKLSRNDAQAGNIVGKRCGQSQGSEEGGKLTQGTNGHAGNAQAGKAQARKGNGTQVGVGTRVGTNPQASGKSGARTGARGSQVGGQLAGKGGARGPARGSNGDQTAPRSGNQPGNQGGLAQTRKHGGSQVGLQLARKGQAKGAGSTTSLGDRGLTSGGLAGAGKSTGFNQAQGRTKGGPGANMQARGSQSKAGRQLQVGTKVYASDNTQARSAQTKGIRAANQVQLASRGGPAVRNLDRGNLAMRTGGNIPARGGAATTGQPRQALPLQAGSNQNRSAAQTNLNRMAQTSVVRNGPAQTNLNRMVQTNVARNGSVPQANGGRMAQAGNGRFGQPTQLRLQGGMNQNRFLAQNNAGRMMQNGFAQGGMAQRGFAMNSGRAGQMTTFQGGGMSQNRFLQQGNTARMSQGMVSQSRGMSGFAPGRCGQAGASAQARRR